MIIASRAAPRTRARARAIAIIIIYVFRSRIAPSIYRARHVSASITSCQCNWLSRQPCTRWACTLDDVTSQLARAFYRVPEEGRGYKRPLPLHRPIDVKRSTARYVQDLVRNRFISLSCIFETRVFFILVTP